MTQFTTKRPLPMTIYGVPTILPANTALIKTFSGQGKALYAVKSIDLLIKLSGNTHDPHYYYTFVDESEVQEG